MLPSGAGADMTRILWALLHCYEYLLLELQSHISKVGCLPSTDESLQFDLPLSSDSLLPVGTWKGPRLGLVGTLAWRNTDDKFGPSLCCPP